MRVFIDVGAHMGESVQEALDPRYRFDRVIALEPAKHCVIRLRGFRDRRIAVEPFGLGQVDGTVNLYAPGTLGGSVYKDKNDLSSTDLESVQIIDAARWVRENVSEEDKNYLKLNCEGAEVDILQRLVDENLTDRFQAILISMDVRKIPSLAQRAEEIESLANSLGNVKVREDYFGKGTGGSLRLWLNDVVPQIKPSLQARWGYRAGLYKSRKRILAHWLRILLPNSAFKRLASTIRN